MNSPCGNFPILAWGAEYTRQTFDASLPRVFSASAPAKAR
jgi:hypothetical protein